MHIELTDHLRCPESHAEEYLVLLPQRVEGRDVLAGHLGCPICGWSTTWDGAAPAFGSAWESVGTPPFDAAAAHAMLGIDGPGGWVALAGNAGTLAEGLAMALPGVSLVAINPPDTSAATGASVVTGDRWPLKSHSMRGVILGADAGQWTADAVAAVLPGLRVVGVGTPPEGDAVELLAQADDVWVAKHRSQ